jgi:hypothetical protein
VAMIDDVKAVCTSLSGAGWRNLLLKVTNGEFDMLSDDLADALVAPLAEIDRSEPGFEDFAASGIRAIEAREPARSLLYHALASPRVQGTSGFPVDGFPTPVQLQTIENYVYGVQPPTLDELLVQADAAGIVVFALEYRSGSRTPHHRHADLCFSRTGISRAGTASSLFDGQSRQWLSIDAAEPHDFHVRPVRYAPFVASLQPGQAGVLPDRFVDGDELRQFWLPVHKLFDGAECIAGMDLTIDWSVGHVNEKLRRFHMFLEAQGYATGWSGPAIDGPPFRVTNGIAELSTDPADGVGVVVPVAHPTFVAPIDIAGKPLTFSVPPKLAPARSHSQVLARYFSGLDISSLGPMPPSSPDQTTRVAGRSHPAPEIVNARHQVLADGTDVNLNTKPNIGDIIAAGGYDARHYADFTGDGWVTANCAALSTSISTVRGAYSIVSGPDFFPYCDQLQLTEWTSGLPDEIRVGLWAVLPRPLCDTRRAANQTLEGGSFAPPDGAGVSDTTVTAVVCPFPVLDGSPQAWPDDGPLMELALPDGASGVFDPGWDVTTDSATDQADSDLYLTAYGLGTPFVEDAKICAALATYWPGEAPDSARTFQPDRYWPSISPLTDTEIGIVGNHPWDGIKGPVKVGAGPTSVVEYTDIDYADYVDQALSGLLTAGLTSRIDFAEYSRRVLAMAWLYWALGLTLPPPVDPNGKEVSFFQRVQAFLLAKAAWSVLSFRTVSTGDAGLVAAETVTNVTLGSSAVYGGTIYRHGADRPGPSFNLRHVEILEEVDFYTDLAVILIGRGGTAWLAKTIPTS